MIIGLTGGVACGKSSAVAYVIKYGATVIDADKISKEVSESKQIIDEICRQFGKDVASAGKLERKKLAKIVFGDKEKLEKLNSIMHPPIIEKIKAEIEKNREKKLVIVDIPLLYEVGFEKYMDKVIVVSAPFEIQLSRLLARDNRDYETAVAMINSQLPLSEKRKKADIVIENGGTKEELGDKVYETLMVLSDK